MTTIDGADDRPGHRARWVGLAVRLFPSGWQDRYGAEFDAVLEATPMSVRVAFDILVAAVDAHLHPTGPRRRWPLMIERLRLSELAVFASWIVFVVAGLAFQRMTEGAPFTTVAAVDQSVAVAYAAIVGGAIVSLIAVVIAGVPIAVAIARVALEQRRWRQLALLAVPPVSLGLWVGLTAVLLALGDPPAGGPWRVALFVVWFGAFLVAALASTVAVGAAALDAEIDASLYRRAATPAVATAIAMAAVVAAVAAWGIALALVAPPTFWGNDGILGTATPLTWLAVVGTMTVATAVATRGAIRARGDLAG